MKNSFSKTGLFFGLSILSATVSASDLTIPNTFTSGTPAVAAEVNGNFSATETAVDDNNTRITTLENSAVGIEFAEDTGSLSITGTTALAPTNGLTLDITAPGPGFIHIVFSSYLRLTHQANTTNWVVCDIATPTTQLPGSRRFINVPNPLPADIYYPHLTTQGVFEVNAAGTVTVNGRCYHNVAATDGLFNQRSLTATFHGTRY